VVGTASTVELGLTFYKAYLRESFIHFSVQKRAPPRMVVSFDDLRVIWVLEGLAGVALGSRPFPYPYP
jgi:hypothetical protein